MKRIIQFHKAFLYASIGSVIFIALGAVSLVTQGVNLGVDFQAGINQSIQLAYPAAELSYSGTGSPTLSINDKAVSLVFSGANVDSRTVTWDLKTVGAVSDVLTLMEKEGVSVKVLDGAELSATLLIPTYQGDFLLSAKPVLIHRYAKSDAELFGSIDQIRKAVDPIGTVSVQSVGEHADMRYMIRVRDDGSDASFSEKIPAKIKTALGNIFGDNKVVVMQTAYVGARFSKDLADNAWKLTLFTVLAILVYATIRFKIQYSIGAVLAILHDCFVMMAFIVWTRMEFNTTSIAAILTILGYSINDTIVIFDRIRDDVKLDPGAGTKLLLDRAISETLGRTFITTITTMLAVLSLYIFTSGSIKDFALALLVGMVSGTYSTIFIATGFVYLWDMYIEKGRSKSMGKKAA